MKTLSLAFGMCAFLCTPAFAKNGEGQDASDPIVITATRAPAPLSEVGASVSVIDADTLARRQSVLVVDALRAVPGLSFNRNGGQGAVTSVRMRGAEADQTVLLIDGVKLNDPSAPGGGFDFGNLLVGDLERIEVLRGPQSTLHGSQAIGGVINLVTREADGPLQLGVDAETGELQSHRLRGRLAMGNENIGVALAGGAFETQGVSALDARSGGRERDGYQHRAASARVRVSPSDAITVEGRAWWSRGEVGIDGFPAPTFAFADTQEVSTIEERILSGALNVALFDGRWRNRLTISQTRTDRASQDPASGVANTVLALGENERFEYQATVDVAQSLQLIGGFERETASLDTRFPNVFDPNPVPTRGEATLQSVYVQAHAKPVQGLSATIGLRHTDDDRFGEVVTARATLAFSPNDNRTILRASVGDGFKAPTPFQLFSDFGNAGLQPEEAYAFDIGLEHGVFDDSLRIGLGYFERTSRNQIDFVSCFGVASPICVGRPFGTYDNVARATANGVEFSAAWRPNANWRGEFSYTALDAKNRSSESANNGRDLPRRPEQTASASITRVFHGGHDLGIALDHVGASFDNASNSRRLKGYTLGAVRGAFIVNDRWSLYARVENISDEVYQSAFGYGALPRQAFIGVRTRF